MAKTLKWGILGTGNIAHTLARAIHASKTGELVAVGSRSQASADKFGDELDVPRRHASYAALLADAGVEAVYISLPNHLHAEWTVKCAEAGKHILCEKPLASNFAEAMFMIEAVERHDVFFMEAFMYRCHPQTQKLVELIRDGAVGQVQNIHASFGFRMSDYQNIRLRHDAAGGGIMDVGCYTMSIARLIAGAAMGRDFCDPAQVSGWGRVGEAKVDEWANASALFPGDILATLVCGVRASNENKVRVFGTEGWLEIPSPYFASRDAGVSRIIVGKWSGGKPQTVEIKADHGLYEIQVDTVAAHVADRQAPSPCMTWADSLGQQRALDRWRHSVGVTFASEQPEALRTPFGGKPLKAEPNHGMKYGRVAGIDKPISKMVMGSMALGDRDMPHACAMLDYFVQRGGTCIDLAYVYGGGSSERAVGNWVRWRGNREEVVIIDKGCHPPQCDPKLVHSQIDENLNRLQMDYIDLYFLHRDDTQFGVEEWIDALSAEQDAGRIRAFGGSNWSIERAEQANAYAKQAGKHPMVALSNNFALAKWNKPLWAGCMTAADPKSTTWHIERQFPNFAWSSQASGFFSGRYKKDDDDPSMSHIRDWWYNEDNFTRLDRVNELAKQKGVGPTQIAAAYVLCQPFPLFALIGPQTLQEASDSLAAASVELSPDELKWLNLEA